MLNLFGTLPNQVPTNADLGTMAYQDSDSVKIKSLYVDTISTTQGLLIGQDFKVTPIANAVNYLLGQGNVAGSSPILSVGGSDANLNLRLQAKGTGSVSIESPLSITQNVSLAGTLNGLTLTSAGLTTFVQSTISKVSQLTNDSGFITSTASITGNAATATKLATPRTINGVSFDGSANITINAVDSTAREPAIAAGTTLQYYRGDKTWATLNSTAVGLGSVENKSSATIRGELTAANVLAVVNKTSQLTNDSGFITSTASITGNAATATKLATPITINGVSFDGSASITISTNSATATKLATPVNINGVSFDGSASITINAVDTTAREPAITAGTTSQFWKGNKTWASLSSSDVTTALTFTPAKSGANSDITSLTALTSITGPLGVNNALTVTAPNAMPDANTPAPTVVERLSVPLVGTGGRTRLVMEHTTAPGVDTQGGRVFLDAVRNGSAMDFIIGVAPASIAPVDGFAIRGGTNNVEILSGNLGIGISPTTKLHVSGDATITGNMVVGEIYGSTTTLMKVPSSGSYNNITVTNDALIKGAAALQPIVLAVHNGAAIRMGTGNIQFRTNNATSDAMYLDSSGNVGVGVTPSAWGASYKALQVGYSGIMGSLSEGAHLSSNAYYDGTGWKYQIAQNATRYSQVSGIHTWYTSGVGTVGAAVSFTQAMTLDATGNLAVGTTVAGAKLDVESGAASLNTLFGSSATTVEVAFSSSGNSATPRIGAQANDLYFKTSGTERVRIDTSGNLGVGITAPAYKLHVNNGSVAISNGGNVAGAGGVLYFNAISGTTSPMVGIKASLDWAGSGEEQGSLTFWTRNTTNVAGASMSEKMRLDSIGRLGIGMVADQRLTLASGSDSTGSGDGISFYGTSSNKQAAILSYNAGTYNGDLRFYTKTSGTPTTAVTEQMRLDNSGNLILGGTSQLGKLTIGAGSNLAATLAETVVMGSYSTTAQLRYLINHAGTGYLGFGSDGAGALIVGRATGGTGALSAEYARFDTSSNFLVGRTTPFASASDIILAERNQNGNTRIVISNQGTGAGAQAGIDLEAYGGAWSLYVVGTSPSTGINPLTFSYNASEKARFDASGNFLVGATSTLNSSKFLVQTTLNSSAATTLITNTASSGGAAYVAKDDSGTPKYMEMGMLNSLTGMTADYGTAGEGYLRSSTAAVGMHISAYSGAIRFSTGAGTERLRIDSSGNFLIGTQTLNAKFMIKGVGGSANNGLSIVSPNATQSLDILPGFALTNATSTGVQSNTTMTIRSSGNSAGELAFATGNTEWARFLQNGNLLVGRTTEDGTGYKIQVNGSGSFSGTVAAGILSVSGASTFARMTVQTYVEKKSVITASTANATIPIDTANYNNFVLNISATPVTLTFNAPGTGTDTYGFSLKVVNGAAGLSLVFPTVKWPNGQAPSRTTGNGAVDWWYFWTDDNGATWTGSLNAQDAK